jgi:hypothetical protein
MDARSVGLLVVAAGLVVVVAGLVAITGALNWVGRLPGDLRFGSGNTRVFIPITTMVLVSIALSVISFLARRFF